MKTKQSLTSLNAFLIRRILLCLIPLVLLSSWLAFDSVRSLRVQQQREMEHLAKNLMDDVDLFLDVRIRALQMLAESPLLDDPVRWPLLHGQAHGFFKGFGSHLILLETGHSVSVRIHSRLPFAGTMPRPPEQAATAAIAAAASGKPVVSDRFIGALTEEPMIMIAVPAVRNGQTNFVLVTSIATRQFHHYLERFSLPDGWTIHLHDSNGKSIACNTPETLIPEPSTPRSGKFQVHSDQSGWSVFLGISQHAWRSPLVSTATPLIAGILLTTILGLLIGRHISRRLYRDVNSVIQSDIPAQDIIIDKFFIARNILDTVREQMRSHAEKFRQLFDQNPVALALTDDSGKLLSHNAQYLKLFGYSLAEVPTINDWWPLAYPDPAYRQQVMEQWAQAMAKTNQADGHIDIGEFCIQCQRGEEHLVFISVIHIDQGLLACFVDVTEQRRLENEVQKQQKAEVIRLKKTQNALLNQMQDANIAQRKTEEALVELKQRNAALEQFHYTISHDLRTPLVTIETFLGFLEQDLDTSDRSQIENDLQHIRTATRRMDALLNDLGKLLLTKESVSAVVINYNTLVEEICRLVAGPINTPGVELIIHPCQMSLNASQGQLIQIWQNLIENAIKYMGDQTRPVIEVGVEHTENVPVFYVRDNGIGIEKTDQSKIFGLFDQLDPTSPGSGLGLALVKRIVEFYDGRIWVESAGKGQGSCFYFTLSAALAK